MTMPDDPLIAAMVGKLPRAGEAFPPEQRAAWLKMMAMAFDVAYGAGGASVDIPQFIDCKFESNTSPAAPTKPADRGPVFMIDKDGIAKRNDGTRLMPADVAGAVLYDKRGELGDLGAITWADGSRGVLGLQLEIAAAA
jgi:hypothetical protein